METTVKITGMTCGHCVASVADELRTLEGVEAVDIELHSGGVSRAVITSSRPVSRAGISAAVAEAGYTLVPADA